METISEWAKKEFCIETVKLYPEILVISESEYRLMEKLLADKELLDGSL